MHRRLRILLTGASALILVVGCQGGGESVDASATATTRFREGMDGLQGGIERGMPATVTMIDGSRFEPAQVTAVWRNSSAVSHTVTADPSQAMTASNVQLPTGAEPFESETLPSGQTFVRQLTVAGEYRYVCRVHEGSGMVGIITVE